MLKEQYQEIEIRKVEARGKSCIEKNIHNVLNNILKLAISELREANAIRNALE